MVLKRLSKRCALFLLLMLGIGAGLRAQEFHFTQYDKSPMSLNPALTGAFYGDWQLYNNYRSQWGPVLDKPYNTVGLGFQMPVYLEVDKVAFGLYLLNDQAGDRGYQTNHVAFSAAYHKLLGVQELRAGLQLAYTMKSIDEDLSFPEGFNRVTGEFDPELTMMEPLDKFQSNHFDINFGVVYSLNFETFQPEVGIAVFHLNKPTEVFFADESPIETKIVGHASFKSYLNSQLYLDPNFMVLSFNKAKNILVGANVGYEMKPNRANIETLYGGLLVRNGFSENPDAAIVRAGVSVSNLNVGVSYDFNISTLKKGLSSNGSFEFSLSYTAPSTRLIKTKIESERL